MTETDLQERVSEAVRGKYQILHRLGGGGMSQVFLARHRVHGGLFAIKVLAEHLASDRNIVSRFEREARVTASLANTPNIVSIFDICEGNGLHYLVMQFVAGEDLGNYLHRTGSLSITDAANVIAQAAEGLSYAETKRIVHRDLKPGNMLLDETGRVKLLDFGISRLLDLSDGITRAGESMGTPYYMSPEQIRGEACDTRSDLYSLGIVFFELLTGKRPFDNEAIATILVSHLNSTPPSLLEFRRDLPPACDEIVQKLIAKDPADRFQNTAELLRVLIANGATTQPGLLRPTIQTDLREAIEQAQTIPLETALLPKDELDPKHAATVVAVPAITPSIVESAAIKPVTPARKSRKILIIAGIIVLLLIASAGVFLLRHPKDLSDSRTPPPALPQIFSDEHGKMLLVSAGNFHFGSSANGTSRTISISAFYIDETEVSNTQYRQFCEATGHPPPQSQDYLLHPDYPVVKVSYQDAAAYAEWAGRRLPTEEEWEKAARGTDDRLFPWGDQAWTSNIPDHIEPVLSEPERRSPIGAYNMAGNVREWTASPSTPTPEENAIMKRLLNGQSFSNDWRLTKGGDFAPGAHGDFEIALHRGLPVDASSVWIGFRCVRSVAQNP